MSWLWRTVLGRIVSTLTALTVYALVDVWSQR